MTFVLNQDGTRNVKYFIHTNYADQTNHVPSPVVICMIRVAINECPKLMYCLLISPYSTFKLFTGLAIAALMD